MSMYQGWKVTETVFKSRQSNSDSKVAVVLPRNQQTFTLSPDHIVTLWTVAHQAPLSMGFSRQEYWCGLPCLLQGIFLGCVLLELPLEEREGASIQQTEKLSCDSVTAESQLSEWDTVKLE